MADLLGNLYQQLGGVGLNASGSSAPAPYANPLSTPATPATGAAAPTTGFESYIASANAAAAQAARENALLQQQINSLPKLLPYNYAANNAQAANLAAGAVNPQYTKMFNDYLSQAKTNQQRQEADTTTANQLLQQNLQNTLTGNQVTGERTAQDANQSIANINTQAGNFQADTGQAFDANRLAAARTGGAPGGGLTGQAADLVTQNANTQEGRQMASFDLQKQAQDLFKTRTFEDIARSNALATTGATQGESKNNLDLARYIQDYGVNENNLQDQGAYGTNVKQQQQTIEQQRLQALASEQQRQNSLLFNNYLSTLKNPRGQDISLTRSAYGV